ncbi:MAG: hypothetical protein ACOX9R_19700, partial [Armatimonadota bacterium]
QHDLPLLGSLDAHMSVFANLYTSTSPTTKKLAQLKPMLLSTWGWYFREDARCGIMKQSNLSLPGMVIAFGVSELPLAGPLVLPRRRLSAPLAQPLNLTIFVPRV